MHYRYSNDDWGWSWIPMVIIMIAFWGTIIWFGIIFLKRNDQARQSHTSDTLPSHTSPAVQRPSAQEILAERLARGEIEPDEYRRRLEALHHTPGG